ncbi:hypothetical protein [Nonomuraea jabiensis]|uniref:Uncharacterized protein n=1 Tax=Nonomuraea jabiensis TaxID=882448 RepID=A0A7W9GC55_9ACTN|nr:hypothetical protein [Nonomuraea jabiensis]MBB5781070.1 hypothetical protein [Nonomuraea jabiensis]
MKPVVPGEATCSTSRAGLGLSAVITTRGVDAIVTLNATKCEAAAVMRLRVNITMPAPFSYDHVPRNVV